jgi:hypothetical protein
VGCRCLFRQLRRSKLAVAAARSTSSGPALDPRRVLPLGSLASSASASDALNSLLVALHWDFLFTPFTDVDDNDGEDYTYKDVLLLGI